MLEKTILIVDADVSSLNYLARVLQEQRYVTLQTTLGKEGLIFTWRDRPDLIIFDPVLQDISPVEFLDKLRHDPRSANTPILALSSDPNPEQRNICLEAGCNEYVVKSGDSVLILPEKIAQLLSIKQEVIKDGSFLIVFLSAKGGTGTSSLCANCAMAIKENKPEASVVVADLVLPIGSIAPIVGYDGDLNLISVAKRPSSETTKEYFQKHLPELNQWQFQLLPGATDPEGANQLHVARIPEIINGLQASYDYVLVDLGRSLSRISLPIIQRADLVVLIMSIDLSSINLTKTIWKYLQEKGITSENVYVILNRAVGLEGVTKDQAEEILSLPIKTTVPYLGSNFALANYLNQPIITKFPKDTAALVFKNVANDMISIVGKLRNH